MTLTHLDFVQRHIKNECMETLYGHVQNGVVIIEGAVGLPEGTLVTISYPRVASEISTRTKHRVTLPLVSSDHPGTVSLTGDRVAELLEDDDVSA